MKSRLLIPTIILTVISISVSLLMISFYMPESSKVAGFSAYDRIGSIDDAQMLSGYEHVKEPRYVPDTFDFGPQIFRGKGDMHHALTLFYSSVGDTYEDTKSSGFKITFSNHVDSTWEERLDNNNENYTELDNGILSHHRNGVVYWGEFPSVSIYSKTLGSDELEKILLSVVENED